MAADRVTDPADLEADDPVIDLVDRVTDQAGLAETDRVTDQVDREETGLPLEDPVKVDSAQDLKRDQVQGLKPGPAQDRLLEKQTMSTLIVTVIFTEEQIRAGKNVIHRAGHSKGQASQPTAHARPNKEDLLVWIVNIRQDNEERPEQITIKDHEVAVVVEGQEDRHQAVAVALGEAVADEEEAEVVEEDDNIRTRIIKK